MADGKRLYSVFRESNYGGFYVMTAENLVYEEAVKETDRLNADGKSTVITSDVARYFHTNYHGVYWQSNPIPTNFLRKLHLMINQEQS